MTKIKLTKSMKEDILNKIRVYIRDSDEKFVKIIDEYNEFKLSTIKELEKVIYKSFNLSDVVYDFIKNNNLFDILTIYGNFDKLPWKLLLDTDFNIKILPNISYRCPKKPKELIKELNLEKDTYINNWISSDNCFYYDYCKRYIITKNDNFIETKINNLIKEYEEIYNRFAKIILNAKNIQELYEFFIDIPSVKEYCEEVFKSKGSSLIALNNEDIDFVKNYLQANKK